MKQAFLSLIILAGLSGVAQAGGGKYVIDSTPAPMASSCYGAGYEFGIFGAGIFPDGDHLTDEIGGGASLGYFFNENFGLDFSAAFFATDSEVQNYTLDAVYRFPMNCIAPYVLAGGGLHTNGETEGLFRFGAGVDFRLFESSSLFADGIYNLVSGEVEDYAIARIGLRFAF
ncbi:MAG: outer membrane beta-barrel protein [Verrucomicrobiae bacterium]|nr:outer membrane beta-barrel protein [Verrucomicrobiae bacterium]